MSENFFKISKIVANDFLQNIVFIDDEAYTNKGDKEHDFKAFEMTRVFAKSQKICSIYNPVKETEIDDLITISAKADIVIIDWQINLEKESREINDESDEEDDLRGKYSLQIIKGILSKESLGLKLLVIYTGETNLWQITDNVHNSLNIEYPGFTKGHFEVINNNTKVCIIGKSSIQAKHTTEIQERIKSYEELPEFLLIEFTKMTSGLLSNAAIKGLTKIRGNAYKLINAFDQSIDSAFLSHKALLPNPDDAEEQFLDILGSELKSILKGSNNNDYLTKSEIKVYLEQVLVDKKYAFCIPQQENLETIKIPNEIERDILIKFTEVGIENFFFRKDTPTKDRNLFSENCYQDLTNYYASSDALAKESNKGLALLTSIKSIYNSTIPPLLTQGSIVFKKSDDTYWLCIQPKCETVRVEGNRNFLFLPLKIVSESEHFNFLLKIIDKYIYFRVVQTIYKSQFFTFKANGNREIRGVLDGDKIIIKGTTNPSLEWIGELKSDFAQSLANQFASNLSRVGMDHSEWLRRSS
jgi:hypothetical protein